MLIIAPVNFVWYFHEFKGQSLFLTFQIIFQNLFYDLSCMVNYFGLGLLNNYGNMDKETFLKELTRIDAGILAFQAARRQLEAQYIEANKPFEVGEVVKVVTPEQKAISFLNATARKERKAIVNGFIVNGNGQIETLLYKMKKDGKPSEFKEFTRFGETIEKA